MVTVRKNKKAQLKIQAGKNHRFLVPVSSKKAQLKIQAGKNHRFLVPVSSKKAQLKIQEMAFFLVAVVLFFILAGLFVLAIIYSNLYKSATETAEQRTLSSISNLADSPEFSCGDSYNCVDADKLIALMQNKDYERFWPFSSLRVRRGQAFDKTEEEMTECTLGNYPNCDMFVVYDKEVANERTIASYVALCRKNSENNFVYDHCEIAEFIAGTELKVVGE